LKKPRKRSNEGLLTDEEEFKPQTVKKPPRAMATSLEPGIDINLKMILA